MRLTNLSTPINPPMARMPKTKVAAKETAAEAVAPVDNAGAKEANRVMAKPKPTADRAPVAAKAVRDGSRNNWAEALVGADLIIRAAWIPAAAPSRVATMRIGRTG